MMRMILILTLGVSLSMAIGCQNDAENLDQILGTGGTGGAAGMGGDGGMGGMAGMGGEGGMGGGASAAAETFCTDFEGTCTYGGENYADRADCPPFDERDLSVLGIAANHIAAVFLPALLGYLWIVSPGGVFVLAAAMAATSLALALMIPRHPEPGHETVFSPMAPAPAE